MSPTETILFAAGIGALAALIGAAVGPILGAQRAHRQWIKDQRTRSYEQFLAVAERMNNSLTSEVSGVELFEAAGALSLFASGDVQKLAGECAEAFAGSLPTVSDPRGLREERRRYHGLRRELLAVMRRELGVE